MKWTIRIEAVEEEGNNGELVHYYTVAAFKPSGQKLLGKFTCMLSAKEFVTKISSKVTYYTGKEGTYNDRVLSDKNLLKEIESMPYRYGTGNITKYDENGQSL